MRAQLGHLHRRLVAQDHGRGRRRGRGGGGVVDLLGAVDGAPHHVGLEELDHVKGQSQNCETSQC